MTNRTVRRHWFTGHWQLGIHLPFLPQFELAACLRMTSPSSLAIYDFVRILDFSALRADLINTLL